MRENNYSTFEKKSLQLQYGEVIGQRSQVGVGRAARGLLLLQKQNDISLDHGGQGYETILVSEGQEI